MHTNTISETNLFLNHANVVQSSIASPMKHNF